MFKELHNYKTTTLKIMQYSQNTTDQRTKNNTILQPSDAQSNNAVFAQTLPSSYNQIAKF